MLVIRKSVQGWPIHYGDVSCVVLLPSVPRNIVWYQNHWLRTVEFGGYATRGSQSESMTHLAAALRFWGRRWSLWAGDLLVEKDAERPTAFIQGGGRSTCLPTNFLSLVLFFLMGEVIWNVVIQSLGFRHFEFTSKENRGTCVPNPTDLHQARIRFLLSVCSLPSRNKPHQVSWQSSRSI